MLLALAALVGCGGVPALAATPTGGGLIVFVSGRNLKREIYSMYADGSSLTRLTVADADVRTPSWSPDGQRIAFERNLRDPEIYVMNADGTGQTRLTDNEVEDLARLGPGWDTHCLPGRTRRQLRPLPDEPRR